MLRLRKERLKRGLSQFKLAVLTNIHPSNLCHLELGKVYPCAGWRKRLAEALGWPIEEADRLFEEVGEDEV